MKYKLSGASQKSYEGIEIKHGETLKLADGAGAIAFGKLICTFVAKQRSMSDSTTVSSNDILRK